MSDQPMSATRAVFPADYGSRGGEVDEALEWEHVEQRLRDAPNYWVATVTTDGRPHTRPVDGVWVDGALCFGGSPETRWVRNLHKNPIISVHLPSGDDVVILDGTAEYVTEAEHRLAAPTAAASKAKYPQYYPGDHVSPFRPFWALRPTDAYAWTLEGFPNRATRWTFDR
jgi:nitroimidazol reductase NimA-like FMN-containing flavoprotein (pyridoxamine 5'-phosphate oxidase superfamily)